jgi:hypothetical protein
MTIYNNEPRVPNLTTATSLMETFAYKAVDGFWYTTDATGQVIYKTHLLAVLGDDEDVVHGGINVKLDDIPILCPTGWSDVAGATDDWATAMTAFGLGAARDNGDFGAVWQPKILNLEYDAIMQCCESAMFQDPYATLSGYRGDGNRPWANSSGWTGPAATQYNNDWVSWAYANATEKVRLMNEMQTLLANNVPEIICFGNALWNLMNTEYWINWNMNGTANYQDPLTDSTINMMVLKQRLFLGLLPNVEPTTTSTRGGIPWYGLGVSMVVGLAAIVSIVAIRRRREH